MRITTKFTGVAVLGVILAGGAGGSGGGAAYAQGTEYRLDESGQWEQVATPEAGSDAAVIAEARRHLAENRPEKAKVLLDDWLEERQNSDNPFLPQAYLLRGDALTASGNEYKALYDYEQGVILRFPATEEFILALERELEIGIRYVNGLRYKWLGMRIWHAGDVGEELLIRVQERLPNSRLAERAGIELADYYYRTRDLELAGEAYELFLVNYPNSAYKMKAMERRVYSSIGQYRGPLYDSSSLLDAQALIRRFSALYPEEAEQTGLNDALVARLEESAAAELLESARWYMKQGDAVSARHTLSRLVAKHPSTAAGTVALRILTDKGWIDDKKKAVDAVSGEKEAETPASSTEESR